jgi:hypothetical protein
VSTLIEDDGLLDDMARTLSVLRDWFSILAEEHLELDVKVIDELLARYKQERTA